MAFHIGQKVTLKREYAISGWRDVIGMPIKDPEFGVVYTVVDVDDESAETFLDLEGLPENSYWASAFRPVRTTDISVFKALLNPTRADGVFFHIRDLEREQAD